MLRLFFSNRTLNLLEANIGVDHTCNNREVGPWSIFARPSNGSTSLQNSLFEHNAKGRSAKRRKTAQLRSKQRLRFSKICSRSYFAVTLWLLRSHFAVTTWWCYAVAMVTTRSLRGYYGHHAVATVCCAVRKSIYSRLRKRSTSLQNGLFGNIVAVLILLLLQTAKQLCRNRRDSFGAKLSRFSAF